MAAQVHATEVTADGEVMHVRVTAEVLNAHLDFVVAVETQNADIALARAEEKLIDAFEGAARKLREEGLHLHV
jgi:hypothetical protein